MAHNYYASTAARWQATSTRDSGAATAFVYAVKTTHIFCRPNCKSRLACRSNVAFFNSSTDAMKAGYRACKRCKPQQDEFEPERDLVASLCARLDGSGTMTLADMAAEAGLSRWHFWRIFKKVMGVTPSQWSQMNCKANTSRSDSGIGSSPADSQDIDLHFLTDYVQYTTVHTNYGVLLVAFQQGQISKLDLAPTIEESLFTLDMAFPFPKFVTSALSGDASDHELRAVTQEVVEALERPSGKTLTFSVSNHALKSLTEKCCTASGNLSS
ncbi:hypothetical protein LTR78_010072 [Recurvomyces mirabilis]|uniref:HTH araC/xylS-type domain-containing protein n=1 Tax=Recurvomyces mirabilis TaxID=574656 RepID=A0AAE0WF69_9PEZI|nr:hypothetical protein LTR78_010072 [Recurvomyces mirabilis]KAK5159822.1 hypothetical protein LTS14_001927 [Recurvomyces mirabilis]